MTRSSLKRPYRLLLGIVSFALAPSVLAAAPLKKGTFATATETHWGAAFELKESGRLIVTPFFNDEPGTKIKRPKTISGTWRETDGGIELTYAKFKDRFVLQKPCKDWKEYPCFRYQESVAPIKQKSPLNLNYAYINWDWKIK